MSEEAKRLTPRCSGLATLAAELDFVRLFTSVLVVSLLIALHVVIADSDAAAQPPRTLARAAVDVNGDGHAGELTLVWVAGRYSSEDRECFGGGYQGDFVFRVAFANGTTVDTSLRSVKSIASCFAATSEPWPIVISDYNHDGHPDFNIGTYGDSNGGDFQLFTILPSGQVRPLRLPAPGYLYATMPGGHSTSQFKAMGAGFSYVWSSIQDRQDVRVLCSWDRRRSEFSCKESRQPFAH